MELVAMEAAVRFFHRKANKPRKRARQVGSPYASSMEPKSPVEDAVEGGRKFTIDLGLIGINSPGRSTR